MSRKWLVKVENTFQYEITKYPLEYTAHNQLNTELIVCGIIFFFILSPSLNFNIYTIYKARQQSKSYGLKTSNKNITI